MRLRTEKLFRLILVGVPLFALFLLGLLADFICWEWAEQKCEEWFSEMKEAL